MVWKQDLAKLKQQLSSEPAPAAPKPPPKVAPKASGGPIEEEDAVFLAAMGLKPAAPKKQPRPAEAEPLAPSSPEPSAPETFEEALKDLKGLKPLPMDLSKRARPAKAPQVLTKVPEPTSPPLPVIEAKAEAPPPPAPLPPPHQPTPRPPAQNIPATMRPIQFQLAAGMALEVDASLDLRGHSLTDAMERLKDRLGDGQLLGWHILQVTLGSDPVLHEGLLALLAAGEMPMVARFAQAPIPMGGNQAWLLYFCTATTLP